MSTNTHGSILVEIHVINAVENGCLDRTLARMRAHSQPKMLQRGQIQHPWRNAATQAVAQHSAKHPNSQTI